MVSHMGHVNFEKSKRSWNNKKFESGSNSPFSIQFERKLNLASVFGPSQSATLNLSYQH